MTREEAISEWTFRSKYIKRWLHEYGEEPSIRHYVELIDMAIEALSTTNTEKLSSCGDLISRADAIEAVCTWGTTLERNGKTMMTMVDVKHAFIKTIEELPSAEPTDLISRADAIAICYDGKVASVHDVADKIKQLPSADRPSGEWKERDVIDDKEIEEWQEARCSVCGKWHTTPYMYYFEEYSYCPNCGAKMGSDTR